MLKRRIGALLPVKDGLVVRSTSFHHYLPVGKPAIAIEFLNQWGIDEIIMLDISASKNQKTISSSMVAHAAKKCFVPLAVGGGVLKMEDVDALIHQGADKIVLNQVLFKNEGFLESVAKKYGDQCAVACIDVRKVNDHYKVYDHVTKSATQKDVADWAHHLQELGAGEVLVHAVDRDGAYSGFEENVYKQVCERVTIPVIAAGGAGSPEHFVSIFKNTTVSAACAGNYFHFSEHSVGTLKSHLIKSGIKVRHEGQASYTETQIDSNNRIQKKSDDVLEHMLYQKIEKEII
jgi:imidazole glycerol-phosphate synthase subunit HisF